MYRTTGLVPELPRSGLRREAQNNTTLSINNRREIGVPIMVYKILKRLNDLIRIDLSKL